MDCFRRVGTHIENEDGRVNIHCMRVIFMTLITMCEVSMSFSVHFLCSGLNNSKPNVGEMREAVA